MIHVSCIKFNSGASPEAKEKSKDDFSPLGKKNTFALRRVLYHIPGLCSRENSALFFQFLQEFGLFPGQLSCGDVRFQEVRPPLLRDPQGFPPPVPADAPVVP